MLPILSYFLKRFRPSLFSIAECEKVVQRVCSNSPEEHLQPFKDKMEAFVLSGENSKQMNSANTTCRLQNLLSSPLMVLRVTPIIGFVGFIPPPTHVSQSHLVGLLLSVFGRLEGSWLKARRSDKDRTDLAETKTHTPWDKIISLTGAFAALYSQTHIIGRFCLQSYT